MANTVNGEPNEAVKVPRQNKDWAEKVRRTNKDFKQLDHINYDLAPLDGPVIYLSHTVSK